MSQTTAQQRYRQTEGGRQKHREAERRRQARLRGEDVPKLLQNGEKTHCGSCGVPYDDGNTYWYEGSRRCQNCHRNQVKAAYTADPEPARQRSRARHVEYGEELNQAARERRAADPESFREQERARYAASPRKRDGIKHHRHGMTSDEWLDMLEAQQGCCYLCGRDLGEVTKHIHLDHDHRCCPPSKSCHKCRRGLACNKCNVIAGWARDDPELLRKIADNLEIAVKAVTERLREDENCKISQL